MRHDRPWMVLWRLPCASVMVLLAGLAASDHALAQSPDSTKSEISFHRSASGKTVLFAELAADGQPVPGASVSSLSHEVWGTTDIDGTVTLALPQEEVLYTEIDVSLVGYFTWQREIRIAPGDSVSLAVGLELAPGSHVRVDCHGWHVQLIVESEGQIAETDHSYATLVIVDSLRSTSPHAGVPRLQIRAPGPVRRVGLPLTEGANARVRVPAGRYHMDYSQSCGPSTTSDQPIQVEEGRTYDVRLRSGGIGLPRGPRPPIRLREHD